MLCCKMYLQYFSILLWAMLCCKSYHTKAQALTEWVVRVTLPLGREDGKGSEELFFTTRRAATARPASAAVTLATATTAAASAAATAL